MPIVYHVEFKYDNDKLSIIHTLPDETRFTSTIAIDKIQELVRLSDDINYRQSQDLTYKIGKELFQLIDGESQALIRSIKEADSYGKDLHMHIKTDTHTTNLPFELLFKEDFLIPKKYTHYSSSIRLGL